MVLKRRPRAWKEAASIPRHKWEHKDSRYASFRSNTSTWSPALEARRRQTGRLSCREAAPRDSDTDRWEPDKNTSRRRPATTSQSVRRGVHAPNGRHARYANRAHENVQCHRANARLRTGAPPAQTPRCPAQSTGLPRRSHPASIGLAWKFWNSFSSSFSLRLAKARLAQQVKFRLWATLPGRLGQMPAANGQTPKRTSSRRHSRPRITSTRLLPPGNA